MSYNFDHESDNETVQQTETIQQPIVTLQYLLNQNKMKQIALSKATHLIELYKIELQVKQQDYLKEKQFIKQQQKDNYDIVITELQQKILDLERQLRIQQNQLKEKQRIIKEQQHVIRTQQIAIKELERRNGVNEFVQSQKWNDNSNGVRIPRMVRNSSGKDLSVNKKGRYSQSKINNTSSQNKQSSNNNNTNKQSTIMNQGQHQQLKRSMSSFMHNNQFAKQQQLYRFEKSFLIDYLLTSEQKDEKIISQLVKSLQSQTQSITQLKSTIKSNDRFIQTFIKALKQPSIQIQSKFKSYQEIVKIQELIIQQLNGQLTEYQSMFELTNNSLEQIYQQQQLYHHMSPSQYCSHQSQFIQIDQCRESIHEVNNHILTKVKKHKISIKQKILNMEAENKQLKRILQDMIKLIKNNQKIQSLTINHQSISSSLMNKNQNQSSSFTNKNTKPTSFQNTKISSFGFQQKMPYGNISNLRTAQDMAYSKQRPHSHMINRK